MYQLGLGLGLDVKGEVALGLDWDWDCGGALLPWPLLRHHAGDCSIS